MSFTTDIPVPYLGAVRTPLLLRVEPGNYKTQTGFKSQWFVAFGAGATAGDTVQITYGSKVILMTCVASMTGVDDGLSFDDSGTDSIAAMHFADGCLLNYDLSRDFIIEQSATVITFTARNYGTAYDLAGIVSSSGMVAGDTMQAAIEEGFGEDYTVGVEIYLETELGSEEYIRLPQQWFSPDEDLMVDVWLDTMLLPYVDEPDWPEYGFTAGMLACEKSQRRYYARLWERYVNGLGVLTETASYMDAGDWGSEDTPKMAWFAGHQRRDAVAWDDFVTSLTPLLPNAKPWLTWRNRTYRRKVTTAEQHFLGYHLAYVRDTDPGTSLPEELDLEARLTYTDADLTNETTTAWTVRYSDDALLKGHSGIFPTGYDQLALVDLLPADKLPKKYEVRLVAHYANTVLSETMTFWVDDVDVQEQHLQFWSSLGMPETLRTTGAWLNSAEHEYQEQAHPGEVRQSLQDTAFSQLQSVPLGGQRKLVVDTGLKNEAEHKAILDVLGSPGVRWYDHANERMLPVRIVKSKEVKIKSRGVEGEYLYRLEIVFMEDQPEEVVTLIPAP